MSQGSGVAGALGDDEHRLRCAEHLVLQDDVPQDRAAPSVSEGSIDHQVRQIRLVCCDLIIASSQTTDST